jgi:type IV pilus assembly protein PilB
MISSAVKCIVAQRLVRKLCDNCKTEDDVSSETLDDEIKPILKGKKIYTNKGCTRCNNTGYYGRVGIYSVLIVSRRIREMLLERKSTDSIKEAAMEEGMRTLLEAAAEKVASGTTSLEEMYRVVL